MSLSAESSFSAPPTDASSNSASASSTPPTTIPDTVSLASDVCKADNITVAEDTEPSVQPQEEDAATPVPGSGRARRVRASVSTYNLSQLSGTAAHGKRRAKGDIVEGRRRKTISGDMLTGGTDGLHSLVNDADRLVRDGIDALDLQWSMKSLNTPRSRKLKKHETPKSMRASSRLSGRPAETLATKLATLTKKSRKNVEKNMTKMTREMRRLQDTDEFAHIDMKPVLHTVWSNGKLYVEGREQEAPARKKAKVNSASPKKELEKQEEPPAEPAPRPTGRRVKKWLNRGLYAGQETPTDPIQGLTTNEKKKLATIPELKFTANSNKTLPLPMFNGLRLLLNQRDFKLPFDVCNPLPPGQPKPDEWRKMTRSQ
jgi:[histone H3]-lysine4 N-trimethyltransferase ASH1L